MKKARKKTGMTANVQFRIPQALRVRIDKYMASFPAKVSFSAAARALIEKGLEQS